VVTHEYYRCPDPRFRLSTFVPAISPFAALPRRGYERGMRAITPTAVVSKSAAKAPSVTERYIIVSNRLPITVHEEAGELKLETSPGGLATALAQVHGKSDSAWVGWPGDTSALTAAARSELDVRLRKQGMTAVHLGRKQVERYYEGFANGVLWPLFHYSLERVRLDAWRDWEAYREANELFANAVVAQYRPGDRIWVHDYQLALVPALLRERLPDASIGFFLHIPFPASGVFRILPWRSEILEGILGADVVGFHTFSYQRHFASSLLRLLGLDVNMDTVEYKGRVVRIGAFPISIDVDYFAKKSARSEIDQQVTAPTAASCLGSIGSITARGCLGGCWQSSDCWSERRTLLAR
jgi:trehalose 6-phosphate synthase/phosphatase